MHVTSIQLKKILYFGDDSAVHPCMFTLDKCEKMTFWLKIRRILADARIQRFKLSESFEVA